MRIAGHDFGKRLSEPTAQRTYSYSHSGGEAGEKLTGEKIANLLWRYGLRRFALKAARPGNPASPARRNLPVAKRISKRSAITETLDFGSVERSEKCRRIGRRKHFDDQVAGGTQRVHLKLLHIAALRRSGLACAQQSAGKSRINQANASVPQTGAEGTFDPPAETLNRSAALFFCHSPASAAQLVFLYTGSRTRAYTGRRCHGSFSALLTTEPDILLVTTIGLVA